MKNKKIKDNETIGKLILCVLLVLTSFGLGCHKNTGDAKATWDFWTVIQEPLPRNTLFHRMEGFNLENASPQDMQAMCLLMQQMVESCRAKASQITSANVAGVDIDAANYGVKKAQLLVAYSKLYESVAQLIQKQNNLASGQDLFFGYLFSLARHSDEGEDAWWNAGKEELVDKAKTFGNLQVEGQDVVSYAQSLGDDAAQFLTVEMQTRVSLTQRYGKEFPTSQSLAANRPATEPVVIASEKLKAMQPDLMKDLLGRKITTASAGDWIFESPAEFQTFDVAHGTNYGDVMDFEVSTHVKGFFSGAEHDFRLLMTYQNYKDSYRLMFVKPF